MCVWPDPSSPSEGAGTQTNLPIAFVNITQIFVKLAFVAMIKNRQQNFLFNQQISFCSDMPYCNMRHIQLNSKGA